MATMYGPAHRLGTKRCWAAHKDIRGDGPDQSPISTEEFDKWFRSEKGQEFERSLQKMGEMSQSAREDLKSKQFAIPTSAAKKMGVEGEIQGESKGKYPIPDEAHARNALARVSQFGTPAEREMVRQKVYSKYPDLKENFTEQHGESPTSEKNVRKKEQGDVGISKESLASFSEEFQKIAASMSEVSPAIPRSPLDTLDRRTIRAHRKPNVRFIPTSTASGKIVK